MPTVRPDIKPCATFPAPIGKTGALSMRIFPAEQWEKFGGEPGQFRVMVGEAWVSRQYETRSFYEVEELKEVVWRWIAGAVEIPLDAPGANVVLPDVQPGALVTWCEPGTPPVCTRTRTHAFRDAVGDWRVWVFGNRTPVPLGQLSHRGARR
jgi:hypothetical protein